MTEALYGVLQVTDPVATACCTLQPVLTSQTP